MQKFVHFLWDEWTGLSVDSKDEACAEASGILSFLEKIPTGERITKRFFVVRRLHRLWRVIKEEDDHFGRFLVIPPTRKGKVRISIPEENNESFSSVFFRRRPKTAEKWLKGVFGACGAVYVPRVGYYVLFRFNQNEESVLVADLLKEWNISFGERTRGRSREILLRDQQDIVSFLSRINLVNASLHMENMAIFRSMRDKANKLVNCDASNIRKSLETAQIQLRYASFLKKTGIIETLPEQLREVIELRISNPSASLSELGTLMNPGVSKSTVLYRWKKLREKYPADILPDYDGATMSKEV